VSSCASFIVCLCHRVSVSSRVSVCHVRRVCVLSCHETKIACLGRVMYQACQVFVSRNHACHCVSSYGRAESPCPAVP
jgi:hypothetical protein